MTITSKFNIGDKVWCIIDGKAISFVVGVIQFPTVKAPHLGYISMYKEISYRVGELEIDGTLPIWGMEESKVFKTKEELITSL